MKLFFILIKERTVKMNLHSSVGLALAIAVAIAAVVIFAMHGAGAEEITTTFRDSFGRTVGQSRVDSSGTERFYDPFGRSTGTARPGSDGTTRIYDSLGRYRGSAQSQPRRR